MPDRGRLLSSEQMAYFADEGFLRWDGIIPAGLCGRLVAEFGGTRLGLPGRDHPYNRPLGQMLEGPWRGTAIAEVLALPAVRGLIASLVGNEPLYDHHVNHVRPPHEFRPMSGGGSIHQDFAVDVRPFTFDINLSIFPHAVPAGMGGTLLVPGSHFRRIHDNNLYRYQHMRGALQVVCPAGTIVAWHGALWHAGRPNHSDQPRTMFKLRLNPTAPQVRLWDTSDLATFDPLPILRRGQPWMSNHLIEYMHRARLWRYLSGNPAFDIEGFWTRVGIAFDADRADPRYRIPALDASLRQEALDQVLASASLHQMA
jgi:hypothetical protein